MIHIPFSPRHPGYRKDYIFDTAGLLAMLREVANAELSQFTRTAPRYLRARCPDCGTEDTLRNIFDSAIFVAVRFINFALHAYCRTCQHAVVLLRFPDPYGESA